MSSNSSATSQAAKTVSNQWWSNINKEKMPILIIIAITVLIIVLVIMYITFRMRNKSLVNKTLLPNPIKIDTLSTPYEIAGSDIPKPAVGREYTLAFWIYVDNLDQTPSEHKLVLYRGAQGNIDTASHVVFMNGKTNTLYLATKCQNKSVSVNNSLKTLVDTNYYLNKSLKAQDSKTNFMFISKIDYIPLQRWVNIGYVVDNRMVTVYLDGEIYSVKTIDEFKAMHPPEYNPDGTQMMFDDLMFDKSEGSIYIGKDAAVANGTVVSGYVSKLVFANYAGTMTDVRNTYGQGPMGGSGFLSKLGINIGIRSPFYKLDEAVR